MRKGAQSTVLYLYMDTATNDPLPESVFVVQGDTDEEKVKNFFQSLMEEADSLKSLTDEQFTSWENENLQFLASFLLQRRKWSRTRPNLYRKKYTNLYSIG